MGGGLNEVECLGGCASLSVLGKGTLRKPPRPMVFVMYRPEAAPV